MKLTIEQVKKIAMRLYEQGGDRIIECYTDKEIEELIESGFDTEQKLINFIRNGYEVDEEYRKAALWGAYGTTDEEELERIHRAESEPVETEDFEDDFNDPCFGCQACSSYACKHCQHGDDGNYSVYDVYTPSELGVSVKW